MNGKQKVLVYGTGKSGIGAARLLYETGNTPILYDENEKADRDRILAGLPGRQPELLTGVLPTERFGELSCAVLSPGVPTDGAGVLALKEAGIPILGELELAWRSEKGRVLAVTGTNGKTTTTALLGEIMKEVTEHVLVVGNIGRAYTGEVLTGDRDSVTVAEVSSFQLETAGTFHPAVSAILNITEDHLNRHHTMAEYIRVKELIAGNQTKEDTCVLNYEDPVLRDFGASCPARVIWFSSLRELPEGFFLRDGRIVFRLEGKEEELLPTAGLYLIGRHNHENIMAAAAMALAAGASPEQIRRAVTRFRPVAHRIEYVEEKNGVIWYNDSKGTNPDAAIKGIEAMERPTLLIAGGYDKGSDYREWLRACRGRIRYLVLEGKTRFDIEKAALSVGIPGEQLVILENMEQAMEFCRTHARTGEAVLLSPACASWGEFPNYEVRGDRFKEYVRNEC